MLSFSVTAFNSDIKIALYSLYRKKAIAAVELNNKIIGSRYSLSRKPSRLAKATISFFVVYHHALVSALMMRKSRAARKADAQ